MSSKIPDVVNGVTSPRVSASTRTRSFFPEEDSTTGIRTVVQKGPAQSRNSGSPLAFSPRPREPGQAVDADKRPTAGRFAKSQPAGGAKASQRRTMADPPAPSRSLAPGKSSFSEASPRAKSANHRSHVDPVKFGSPRAMSPASRGLLIPSQRSAAPPRLQVLRSENKPGGASMSSQVAATMRQEKAKKVRKPKPSSDEMQVVTSKSVSKLPSSKGGSTISSEKYKVTLTQRDADEIVHAVYHENRRGKRIVCLHLSKYSVLRTVAKKGGYLVEESRDGLESYRFYMCWSDTVLPLPALVRFSNWQRSNHFPSMYLLCRKGHLGATLTKLHNMAPLEYRFYPRTWLMRTQKELFRSVLKSKGEKTSYFIMKPNSGCQGRGIVVTKDPFSTSRDLDNYIVQEYVRNPLLLEGKKFDLRVYVLLTSIREPSIFIFEDGLVRICTDAYEAPTESNVKNACKHLTNYAVNKRNPNFVYNTDSTRQDIGNKRNFKFFNSWMESQGHSSADFWSKVGDIVTKTILAAQPQLANVYNSCFPIANEGYTCFEVLGFDILVDDKLKPWLLEVNHTPSFATDTPLDMDIKSRVLSEVWDIIDIQPADWERDMLREQYEYTRRSLPPWAKNHPIYSKHLTVSAKAGKESREAVVINPSDFPPGASATASASTPGYVTNRRAQENAKLRGFKRVYPSTNRHYEFQYERIRRFAAEAWSTKPPELRTAAPTPTASPPPPDPVTLNDDGVDDKKSMSRPMPTSDELKWLQELQEKLDLLSEDDPKPEDLELNDDDE